MKISLIGAGSHFGWTLSKDILSLPALQAATLALCDINEEKLELTAAFIRKTIEAHNLPAKVDTSTDRRAVLDGADFVVTSIAVGGPAYASTPFKWEIEIPRKYGVDQSVADTIGPGGVFRFLRTAPVQYGVCQDMRDLCPDALLLNYTNPMCMLTWIHSDTGIANVGLCHSVQHTHNRICGYIDVPADQARSWVAGINHQAWFLSFTRNGEDLYPALRQAMDDPETRAKDPVRFEMMRHFGCFVTESSHHNSEYLPYFRRTPELLEHYGQKSREVPDEPRAIRDRMAKYFDGDGNVVAADLDVSHEFASRIIEASVTNQPYRFNGNVMNRGGALIPNLPGDCCVEVPCYTDAAGVHPTPVGPLPPACAALNRTNVNVQELAVRAFLEKDRELACQACAVDPLTAAVVPLPQIREMFDELWEAESTAGLLDWFGEPST